MDRRGAFDYILLETSGLADPGNIAPLFWVDDGLGSTIYLDGIVTLVDAKNILRSLNEKPANMKDSWSGSIHDERPHITTAHSQISHADVIILNKSDAVSSHSLKQVQERIEGINSLATIIVTEYGRVPRLEGVVLDLHAYDNIGALDATEKKHSHLDPVRQLVPCTTARMKRNVLLTASRQYRPPVSQFLDYQRPSSSKWTGG